MMFSYGNLRKQGKRVGIFTLFCLPILVFLLPFVINGNRTLFGDWDYFAQLYEAARISIVEYNQFPWLNPWMSGGVPLYANPQFGLISLQTPLVLMFGTLTGLRLGVLLYFIIGFWGMRTLLLRLRSDALVATLLSYIWVFSSFPVWRLAGGHLTFGTYFLAPWFFLLLLNVRRKLGWLWLGLFTAFLINQSMHYLTVHILMIAVPLVIYQLWRVKKKSTFSAWELLRPYVLAALVTFPLILHKLYFTFQYLHDFPRIPPFQDGVPSNLITAGLTFRGTKIINPSELFKGGLGWSEYAAYFGLISLALASYLIIKNLQKIKSIDTRLWLLLAGLLLTLLISYGDFSPLSPYGIMKDLPVLSQMQVPSRWLGWFVFGVIILLARLPRKTIFIVLLAITVLDVFQSSYHTMNYSQSTYTPPQKKSTLITQDAFYINGPVFSINSLRLLHATQSNTGDIYGYEPIVGFAGDVNEGYRGLSARCAVGRDDGCMFVSSNAIVEYWSPNYIKLRRVAPGSITINVNPGSYWTVNGARIFAADKIVDPAKHFVIQDSAEFLELNTDPHIRTP